MTALEVLLILLGFVLVALSFLIGDKSEKKEDTDNTSQSGNAQAVWTEKDEELVRKRVNEVIGSKMDVLMEDTNERLNHMCNEKIMAVDEFSSQVMEKIENNHKEVVFMYNMLDEKEKELKKDLLAKKVKPPIKQEQPGIPKADMPVAQINNMPKKPKVNRDGDNVTKAVETSHKKAASVNSEISDKNKKIMDLHKTGKTILEISKELNMGQGEVKLVIDLYGGK